MKMLLPATLLLLAACGSPTDTAGAKVDDYDGDGYTSADGDCDDTNPAAHPHGDEHFYNGVDEDCDGMEDEYDQDLDGAQQSVDCDDEDPTVFPGADEACDGVDNNCDGEVDNNPAGATTWYADTDGDSYGDADMAVSSCGAAPAGYVADATDCDDTNAAVHPGATDYCGNGLDEDCDGADATTGITWYLDVDADNYGDDAASVTECSPPSGYVATGGDCDDADPDINPGRDEACDDLDNDCDGTADEGLASVRYYEDTDGDGYGSPSAYVNDCAVPEGYVDTTGDCDDTNAAINPEGIEVCDGVDDDCDRTVDDGVSVSYYTVDADMDGYGAGAPTTACDLPEGAITEGGDCDDADAAINPGAAELCDGDDNNCDRTVDEGVKITSWPTDADADGYGVGRPVSACDVPDGYVSGGEDCDDADATINPGATEECDSIDNDCDGAVDDHSGCYTDSGLATMAYFGTAQTSGGSFTSGSFGVAFFSETTGENLCTSTGAWTTAGASPSGCPGCDWQFNLVVADATQTGDTCSWFADPIMLMDANFSGFRGGWGFATDYDLNGDGSYLTDTVLYYYNGYTSYWMPLFYDGGRGYGYVDGDYTDATFATRLNGYTYPYYR